MLIWMRDILCLVRRLVWRADISAANNLILRLPWALQCGSDAELRFKIKQRVEHKRSDGSNSWTGCFRGGSCKTRTGQCLVLLRRVLSVAHSPLEVVWVFDLLSSWRMLKKKKKETTGSSNLLLLLTSPPSSVFWIAVLQRCFNTERLWWEKKRKKNNYVKKS